MQNEEWRWIEGEEGNYQVSSLGRVRSFINRTEPLVLSPSVDARGYTSVGIRNRTQWVHRLVAKAFISNPDAKPEVNHIDSTPSNNRLDNLEWVTHRENMRHQWTVGNGKRPPILRGELARAAVMTAREVRRIRNRYAEGDISYDQLAFAYNVSKFCIYAIITRRSWAHIT